MNKTYITGQYQGAAAIESFIARQGVDPTDMIVILDGFKREDLKEINDLHRPVIFIVSSIEIDENNSLAYCFFETKGYQINYITYAGYYNVWLVPAGERLKLEGYKGITISEIMYELSTIEEDMSFVLSPDTVPADILNDSVAFVEAHLYPRNEKRKTEFIPSLNWIKLNDIICSLDEEGE